MLKNLDSTQIVIPAQLDQVVEDALQEVARIHRRRVVTKVCTTAASVFALVGVFLAAGFSNPAMASQIPFLGKIFESASQKGGPVATNLAGYDAMQYIGKKADSDNESYTLTVREVYSDGATVQLGLEMAVPEGAEPEAVENNYGRTSQAAIGGQEAKILTVNPFRLNDGVWESTMSLQVPEGLQEEDKLDVDLTLRDFTGIDGEFKAQAAVVVDKVHTVRFEGLAEDNGAKVLGADVSPTQTVISIVKPYWGEIFEDGDGPENLPQGFPHLYTLDGTQLMNQARRSADEGGYVYDLREEQSADLYFDGPPAGTKQLVLRFIYGDYSDEVLAEFTIDLEKQEIRQGSGLDDGSPYFYQMLQGSNPMPDEPEGCLIPHAVFDKYNPGGRAAVYLSVPEGTGKDLRIEVTDSQGARLAESAWNEAEWFVQEDGERTEYSVSTRPLEMPPIGETVTVTLTEGDKVLCQEEILLDSVTK